MADHLQQTTTGMMILLVLFQMIRQILDTSRQYSNLYLWGPRVTFVNSILFRVFSELLRVMWDMKKADSSPKPCAGALTG